MSQEQDIDNAIDAATSDNPYEVRKSIEAALTSKLRAALDLKKVEVASNLFPEKGITHGHIIPSPTREV